VLWSQPDMTVNDVDRRKLTLKLWSKQNLTNKTYVPGTVVANEGNADADNSLHGRADVANVNSNLWIMDFTS